MKKILLALLASLALSVTPAFAGDSTVGYTAGSGTTFGVVTDGSGNVIGKQAIVDGAAGANKMAVKAASTAPSATDPAAVVALSPNSVGGASGTPLFGQITAGAALIGKVGIDQTTPGTTNGVQINAALPAGTNVLGHIICDSGCSSSTAPSDESAFTAGTTPQSPVGGFFQTTATSNPLTNGQMGALQVTANRAVFSNLRNASGAEIGVAAAPVQVSLANTAANATPVTVGQATAASLNATVVGTGTFVTQSTLAAETTKVIGTVRNLGNAGAITDFAGQNAASPANAWLMGAQFQTTPTTITPGNASPLQLDNAGNLLVNIKAGAGSGGTALGDNAAWTAGTTSMTPAGCEFTTGGATAITTAHAATVGCTAARAMFTDLESVAATALGTPAAYGSTPTGNALSANVFVTNTNANGSATSANSSPVVIASDQAAVAVKAASGAFASGSIASGALASGSIAAGAGVSGAFVAGAIADLAHGQGTMAASVPVTIASNQSAVSVSLAANQSVNVAQFGGVSTSTGQLAVSTAPVTATNTALVVDLRPDSPGIIATGGATTANSVPMILNSQYPVNSVTTAPQPVTATATGTTAATVATIPAVASKTAYICGFTITADATALAVGTAVVSGTISGSLSYLQGVQAVTSGAGNLTQAFNPCIPASAANTAIVVTSAAAGTGGNTIVNAQGYYL